MALFPLPDIITLESVGGDWDRYLEAIYQEFVDCVATANLTFRELPLSCPRKPEFNGMHYSFWHLITEDLERTRNDEDRTPDMRRCERVSWLAHILSHADDPEAGIKCWENRRGSNTHVVLWVEEESFVIILAKRKTYYVLKTMYCHGKRKGENLLKEWQGSTDPRKN